MRTFAQRPTNRQTGRASSTAGRPRRETAPDRLSRAAGHGLEFHFSRIAAAPPFIQPQLSIDTPGDRFEREADDIADKVVRMAEPAPLGPAPAAIQRKCRACGEGEAEDLSLAARQGIEDGGKEDSIFEESPDEPVRRKAESGAAMARPSPFVVDRLARARSGGEPLAAAPKQRMEAAFGRDLSRVRIHRDGEAADLSRQLSARAFTHGSHIYFASGTYDPDGPSGKRLLAHELAHVVQQGHAAPRGERHARPLAGGGRAGAPAIQRVATWGKPSVTGTNNLADRILAKGYAGESWPTFNGDRKGMLNEPTVKAVPAKGSGFNAFVSKAPTNVISAVETVLSAGPWRKVTTRAVIGARFPTLTQCTGSAACDFHAAGDPNDRTVQAANQRHEDHHVGGGLTAFKATILRWDAKLTAALADTTDFYGTTKEDAAGALFAAVGGTSSEVKTTFVRAWNAAVHAYHKTRQGGNVRNSGPATAAPDCSTATQKFANPS